MQLPLQNTTLDTLCDQGLTHHRAGRLDEARERYEAVLAQDADHAAALHWLGVLHAQIGAGEQAVLLIRKSVAIRPGDGEAHGNLANVLNRLGRHAEAAASAEQAIALNPADAAAHGNRGQALHALGRIAEAFDSYDRLAALRPDHGAAHYNRAVMLRELGRLPEALESLDLATGLAPDNASAQFSRGVVLRLLGRMQPALESLDQAIRLSPGHAQAWQERGVVLRALGRRQEALDCYDLALAIDPDYAEALSNRGNVLCDLKRPQDALASYDRALALKPDYAEAWSNRMVALRDLRRPEEALASCERALELTPDYAEGHNNRGGALYEFQRLDEAVDAFDRALALNPDYAEAYMNRGVLFMQQRRFPQAMADLDRSLSIKPDDADAAYSQAMCRLAMGDEAGGWTQYEARWGTRQFEEAVRGFAAPLWLGRESLKGRTILVHAEQGLGDTLQFCRYLPVLSAMGATVVFEVQAGLERLMERMAGHAVVLTRGSPLPDCDFHVPLMSLPLALQASAGDHAGPYLFADPQGAAAWAARLAPGALKVGICWAGGARPDQPIAHAIDLRRSLPLNAFRPLADIEGVQLYSLQKGPPTAELETWNGPPIIDLTDQWKDFADTADFVANLDLVIACDTSTAHLAGGLGKPTWVLNRHDACWRWLHGREDTPWYPTARLFNQTAPGDWDGVMSAVGQALRPMAGQ